MRLHCNNVAPPSSSAPGYYRFISAGLPPFVMAAEVLGLHHAHSKEGWEPYGYSLPCLLGLFLPGNPRTQIALVISLDADRVDGPNL